MPNGSPSVCSNPKTLRPHRRNGHNAPVLCTPFSHGEAAISDSVRPPEQAAAGELAVVIVNFDSGEHLRNCVEHLRPAAGRTVCELVVVDNASTDGSLERAELVDPAVKVLRNTVNLGYGRACNQGAGVTSAPLICFLNPDIVPLGECLLKMLERMGERADAGIMGPRLNNPDGSRYPSARVVPGMAVAMGHAIFGLFSSNNRFTRAYQLQGVDQEREREVDWVSGAAMMVRREAFEAVGGFDEGFFMYVEDVDLCRRISEAGWSCLYYPRAVMMHHVAGSSRRTPYKMIRHHHLSLMRYAFLQTRGRARVLLPVAAVGILVRMLVAWAELYFRERRRLRRQGSA